MRKLQTTALVSLLSVLLVLLAGTLVALALGGQTMTLALTPLGWRVFGVIVVGLALTAAVTLVRESRDRLVAVILVVMLLDLIALVFRPEPLAMFLIAAIILFGASVIGGRREPSGSLVPVVVLSGILVIAAGALLVFNLAMIGVWGSPEEASTVYADEQSPHGGWRLIASENDPGSMGSVSSTVTVRLDLLGLFRLQRELYDRYGSRPAVGWADGDTVEVGDVLISLWSGEGIHD